jgi:hypothetical protein
MNTKIYYLTIFYFIFISSAFSQINTLALSGFNKDLVVNGSGTASSSVTSAFDASNFTYVAQDYPGVTTCFLPNSGYLTSSQTAGLSFQLNNYSTNNAYHVTTATGTGTLALSSPQSITDLYVLWSSGQGASVTDVVVNFTNHNN